MMLFGASVAGFGIDLVTILTFTKQSTGIFKYGVPLLYQRNDALWKSFWDLNEAISILDKRIQKLKNFKTSN